ncbi:MAG: YigZ family protein [Eubacteriales bacterium]|nr:YigZ family protein [Eubacteriales bacterium]
MKPYKTVLRRASDEFIVHKSRFIGYAAPVQSAEEALAFLGEIREKHRDASHNCYAYVIGQNAGVMRYSDDGEPGGTAGLPIIENMKTRGVVNCAVVVTRYFGGVLLGAGGLVRAYRKGCTVALNAAQVCEMHPSEKWLFEVEYPLWDRVQHLLGSLPVQREETDFAATVNFGLMVKAADSESVRAELTRATDGRIESLMTDELYSPWIEAPQAEEEDDDDGSV